MKNNAHGFTLIEVLVGTAISALLMVSLFISLSQINRTKKNLDTAISKSGRVALIHHQLEHDLMGAFVPKIPPVRETPKEEAKEEQKTGDQKKPEQPKKEEKKETEKPKPAIDKIFFSENKGANLQTLTFISNNPMPVYWSKKAGKPQPKIVRIVYRLEQDLNRKNSFKLMRQEGGDLTYDAYDAKIPLDKQKFRPYELINGIKNISALYYYVPVKKQQEQKPGEKKEEQKQEKVEYKVVKEWGKQKKEEKEKSDMPPLPRFVELKLVLWDLGYQRDSTWVFTIPIVLSSQPSPTTPPPAQPQTPKTPPPSKTPLGTGAENK